MASTTRIAELAALIQSNTTALDKYLKEQNIQSLSFEIDAPESLSLPAKIAESREAVLDATDELHALVLGPVQSLMRLNHNNMVSLQAIERFKIANSFPVGEEASFAQISEACKLTEDDTTRILRQAMTQRIFKEPRKGYVAHTAISKQIAESPLIRDWIFFHCIEQWRAAPYVVDAMIKWPGSEEPGQTGWALANNSGETPLFIEVPTKYPERLQRMPGAMQMSEQGDGLGTGYFIDAFDWTGVATFVDVGGAHGSMSIDVARKVPSVGKCIVQDLPFVISTAQLPTDLATRVQLTAHDFFTPQPVKGAEVYFFRWIYHNWSDKYAVMILQNLVPALKKGAKVVANEFLLPEPGMLSPYQEQPIRNFDISMKELLNAKERDAEAWAALFEAADPRYKLKSISVPTGAKLAIIEAVWEGESYSQV